MPVLPIRTSPPEAPPEALTKHLVAWLTALLKCRTTPDFVGLLDMAARDGITPSELAALMRLARGEA